MHNIHEFLPVGKDVFQLWENGSPRQSKVSFAPSFALLKVLAPSSHNQWLLQGQLTGKCVETKRKDYS